MVSSYSTTDKGIKYIDGFGNPYYVGAKKISSHALLREKISNKIIPGKPRPCIICRSLFVAKNKRIKCRKCKGSILEKGSLTTYFKSLKVNKRGQLGGKTSSTK